MDYQNFGREGTSDMLQNRSGFLIIAFLEG
jgi:hypothetical protein